MYGLKKLLRDLWLARGRTLVTVLAIAVGLVGFYGVLGNYGVLSREMARNYAESVPASATLMVEPVSSELLAAVRARPEIEAATRRATLHGRYRSSADGSWQRALVFVVEDFENASVAKVLPVRGEVVPKTGTVLLERSALTELPGDVGTSFMLELPGGRPRTVEVSGVVHEPALAPAKTEQAIYAYISAETARTLGTSGQFDELRVLFREGKEDRAAIERAAVALSNWVEHSGFGKVQRIRVPPPFKHPHQSQMTAVMTLFISFSAVILVMGSFLAATLMSTMLGRQVREIGVMKALGARSAGLVRLYMLVLLALSASAVAIAWFPGELVTNTLVTKVSGLLNLGVASYAVPHWVLVVKLATGLLVPSLVAAPRILRGCGVSVKQALGDHGFDSSRTSASRLEGWLTQVRAMPTLLGYSLRGVLRRRRQFVLAVSLLVLAGSGFIGAMSTAKAWDSLLGQIDRTRHYDFSVRLSDVAAKPDTAKVTAWMARLPGVRAVELWGTTPVALARESGPAIERTYPDDSHGAFHLVAPPTGAELLQVDVTEGRWLEDADTDAIVINQLVPGASELRVGDELALAVAGEKRHFRIVGKTVQVGIGASAYVSRSAFDATVPTHAQHGEFWVAAAGPVSEAARQTLIAAVERELDASRVGVESILPVSLVKNAMAAHFEILVNTLLALAGLIAAIGTLGLGAALSVDVSARTRELGVLRAVGATGGQLTRTIVLEGLSIGFASLALAIVGGAAMALLVGRVVGELSFRTPLPLSMSGQAIAIWVVGALAFSALGALGPALRAGRTSVRDALVWL